MTTYLSRGVERTCNKTNGTGAMSEKQKDDAAAMVLRIVSTAVKDHKLFVENQASHEPTGLGYLGDDVRDFVLKRSA